MNLSNKNASHTCLFEINQNKFFLLVTILFCLFQFLLHVRTLEHKIVVGMDFVTIKIHIHFMNTANRLCKKMLCKESCVVFLKQRCVVL